MLPGEACVCPVFLLSMRRQELQERRAAYQLGERLGKGTGGTCFRARRSADGLDVAVKALEPGPNHLRDAFKEALALDRCRGHPCTAQLLDVFMNQGSCQIHLVLDFAGLDLGERLRAYAAEGRQLPLGGVRSVVRDVASALQCLHGKGFAHADVKPQNILVKELDADAFAAKLGDFGSVCEAFRRQSGGWVFS